MSTRTALLIRWSVGEAARIRVEAAAERRTVIGYVLNIVMRTLPFEEIHRGSGRANRIRGEGTLCP